MFIFSPKFSWKLINHRSVSATCQSNPSRRRRKRNNMPTTLQKAIGAVKDQTTISLAKVYSSSHIEVAVVRATTHDDLPVDERHVYRVLQLVSSNKTYAAACARAIGKRISRTRNWIVALKALMLVLRIFKDGDPYFPREVLQAMKKGAKILNLSDFRDESHSDPWDYTAFVRTFALYLEERLDCFLAGKLLRRYTYIERDGSHSFRKSTNESVRDLKPSILLDRIVSWQRLLHRAIATKPTGSAKMNRLVQISLSTIVKESFDIYRDISNGLAVILDSFFHLQYELCVCALQIYIKAAKQFEELGSFYSLCKSIDVGRTSEYPRVEIISEELIENLQQFLNKGSGSPSSCSNGEQPKLDYRDDKVGDLITGERPFISVDFEKHLDPFEKKSDKEESFRASYTGSAQAMPVKDSTIDLLCLDDWPQEERGEEQERKQDLTNAQQSKSNKDPLQSSSGKGWELVLAENVSPISHTHDHRVYDIGYQQACNYSSHKESENKTGWETMLARPPTRQLAGLDILSNTLRASNIPTLFDQSQHRFSTINDYNPFLANPSVTQAANPLSTSDFGATFSGVDHFITQPTFQTTTHQQIDTFSLTSQPQPPFLLNAHNQYDHFTVGSSYPSLCHNDPFPASSHTSQDEAFRPVMAHSNQSDQFVITSQNNNKDPFTSYSQREDSINEMMKQQRLWLQHQHTNIPRSISDV